MIDANRAEFNAWVRSRTGTLFSPGAPESSNFYYLIWQAGLSAGIERSAKVVEGGRFLTDTAPIKLWADECATAIRALLNPPA